MTTKINRGTILMPAMLWFIVWTGTSSGVTNTYTFYPDQSTVVKTFLHSETYTVSGVFQLTSDANAASFDWVNATFSDDPNLQTGDLRELFYMDELVGDVVNDTTIEFELPTQHPLRQSFDINITLTFQNNDVNLTGQRLPLMVGEPGYTLDAVANLSKIVYVDADAPPGGDGGSWATAFKYLQNALAEANSIGMPFEIRAARGTYKPDQGAGITPGDRTATFQLISGVSIKGGYAGVSAPDPNERDIELYETVLSGDLTGNDVALGGFDWDTIAQYVRREPSIQENSYTVVTASGNDRSAVLDGFTITAGYANDTNGPCDSPGASGAGMYNQSGNPTVLNCTFRRNTICADGGCYLLGACGAGAYNANSNAFFRNCRFIENIVFTGNVTAYGGGMCNLNSSPTLTECVFSCNMATGFDDEYYGGGMCNYSSSPTLTGCLFIANDAYYSRGGGMHNRENSRPTLINCMFLSNTAMDGAGMWQDRSDAVLINCLFRGNSAFYQGGAILTGLNCNLALTNCTFSENSASWAEAVHSGFGSNTTISNCILWDGGDEIEADLGSLTVRYSNIQGGWPGTFNINANPLFVDPNGPDDIAGTEDDNLRLLPGSPCINTGNNASVPSGITTDLDGNPRIMNGTVDMGTYEVPDIIFVDADAPPGGDGSSWATAFKYLQNALAEANSIGVPLEIRAARGTYKPDQGAGITPGDRTATFQLISGVSIKGGYAGLGEADPNARDIELYETILSGDLNGDDGTGPHWDRLENSYHVVTADGTDGTTILDGFTIIGGHADGFFPESHGGGIHNFGGSPTVTNCTFSSNYAGEGGGAISSRGDPTLSNCVFTGNTAHGTGGGLYTWSGNPTLTDCTFTNNTAGWGGGMGNQQGNVVLNNCTFSSNVAESGNGGGMSSDGGQYSLTNCVFKKNSAERGGAFWNIDCTVSGDYRPMMTNCIFSGNSSGTNGGAIFNSFSSPKLVNCVLNGNSSVDGGGGIFNEDNSIPILVNCTFSGNSASAGNGICASSGSDITVNNCILWNGGNEIDYELSSVAVSYSNVQGGWPGTFNINANPLFVDPNGPDGTAGTEDDNLRLLDGSPCIDAGKNSLVPPGITTDLDGNPRVRGEAVDMGAYEFPTVCTWYVDAVGGSDSYDGLTPETAFATIQKGIDSSEHGDLVVVLAGTYTGPGNRDIDFKGKSITVQSTNPEDPNVVAGTIIDCNGTMLERHRGFFFHSGENENSILTGLTITNGYAYGGGAIRCEGSSPKIIGCVLRDNRAEDGGGLDNYGSCPTIIDCVFSGNTAENGAGMYNEEKSDAKVVNCTFTDNNATYRGGAVGNYSSSPTLSNCDVIGNSATEDGGGMHNLYGFYGSPTLIYCIFSGNSAGDAGGGICSHDSSPVIINCTLNGNSASFGGGMSNFGDNAPMLINCIFGGNSANCGGGMYNNDDSMPTLVSCAFTGNSANERGAAIYNSDDGSPKLINCTLSGNVAAIEGGGLYNINEAQPVLHNCILYADQPQEIIVHTDSIVLATFSDIQGGWPGEGNIDAEPLFVDPDGHDNIAGTADDNLRLLPGSPCIDRGSNSALLPDANDLDGDGNTTEPIPWDLDSNPRILPTIVDMGAYEFQGPFYYYVDDVNGNDNNHGWSPEAAFATIQKGVSVANDGYTVWVGPGVYAQPIDFEGKAITVAGAEEPPVLEVPDYYAVSFYHGEGPDSVFKNFVIKGSYAGILCLVASPTIMNVTVVNNDVGVLADAGANPYIINSIFWSNTEGDLFGCSATYSCIEHDGQGEGNIHTNPLFADPANDDYHLRSERGRYWPAHDVWVLDEVTSPCVDAGDPSFDPMRERLPNGGRVNMGAYGGTPYASMSEGIEGDINYDGIVNMLDLARLANNWLKGVPIWGPNIPDTNPPAPPPTWTTNGQPRAISSHAVTMTATISYDESGVEYYFRCTSGGGHDSGWLTFPPGAHPTYTDVNLVFDTEYCYQVMARDMSPRRNATGWSVEGCAITVTPPDVNAPTPNPMEWADPNSGPELFLMDPNLGNFGWGVRMTSATAVDDQFGVEYYFECTNYGQFSSQWQANPYYEVLIGSPYTVLCFRVKARDTSPNHNETAFSEIRCNTPP